MSSTLTTLCIIISGFQLFGTSLDFDEYVNFFNLVEMNQLSTFALTRFEPAFVLSTVIVVNLFSSPAAIYTVFVALSIFLKGIVFYALSSGWQVFAAASLLYLIRYFPLHEYTQLRVAISIGMTMVSTIYLWEGNFKKAAIFIVLSLLFHQSAIAVIPFLFFKPTKRRTIIAVSLAIMLTLKYGSSYFISSFLADTVEIVGNYERNGSFARHDVNLFNPTVLLDMALIVYAFANWHQLTRVMKTSVFMMSIGIAFYFGMTSFPVMAHRLREFFSVFFIIFVIESLRRNIIRAPVIVVYLLSLGLYSYLFFIREGFFN
ncbi:hypothetical protein GTP38_17665 [Duganella sp. FT94W]|uniref:EpsG family protein n=1 Tax=Duganella lactea TaxID=2692173 RepID=A0ABW9VB92_9BURK|nr:EpsG family protein [Duganella lactea]MYM36162.1 hypothetical protein [Duganella lactea]